jgi:hypothetical protein
MAHYIWNVNEDRAESISKFMTDKLGYEVDIKPAPIQEFTGGQPHRNLIVLELIIRCGYGFVALANMPGQCGVLIGHNISGYKREIEVLEMLTRILCYRSLMVSHRHSHSSMRGYEAHGFESVWTRYNTHSGNTIRIMMKDVGNPTEDEREFISEVFSVHDLNLDHDPSDTHDYFEEVDNEIDSL